MVWGRARDGRGESEPGSPPPAADGYVLQMHRIPRHGARDVAFFQHGVLDTSLGWVSAFLFAEGALSQAKSLLVGPSKLALCSLEAGQARQPLSLER